MHCTRDFKGTYCTIFNLQLAPPAVSSIADCVQSCRPHSTRLEDIQCTVDTVSYASIG